MKNAEILPLWALTDDPLLMRRNVLSANHTNARRRVRLVHQLLLLSQRLRDFSSRLLKPDHLGTVDLIIQGHIAVPGSVLRLRSCFRQRLKFLHIVQSGNCNNGKTAKVGVDGNWLSVGIANDANSYLSIQFWQIIFKLCSEVRVFNVVDCPSKSVFLAKCRQTRAFCT